jgi:hypothetical protein
MYLITAMVRWRNRVWQEVERTMTDYVAYPVIREWWGNAQTLVTDEFRAVVEAIIATNPRPVLYAEYGLDDLTKGFAARVPELPMPIPPNSL